MHDLIFVVWDVKGDVIYKGMTGQYDDDFEFTNGWKY